MPTQSSVPSNCQQVPTLLSLILYVRKVSLGCPFYDLFGARMTPLEGLKHIRRGDWSLNRGTQTPQIRLHTVSDGRKSCHCGFRLDVNTIGIGKEVTDKPNLLALCSLSVRNGGGWEGYALLSNSPGTHVKYSRGWNMFCVHRLWKQTGLDRKCSNRIWSRGWLRRKLTKPSCSSARNTRDLCKTQTLMRDGSGKFLPSVDGLLYVKKQNKTSLLLLSSPFIKIALTFCRWRCHLKIPPLFTVHPTVWAKHPRWHLCPGSPHALAKIVFFFRRMDCTMRLQKGVQATAIIMSEPLAW